MISMTFYHELKVVDNMNDTGSLAHGSRYYEHLKVVVDMNEFGGHELRALNAMSSSELWII